MDWIEVTARTVEDAKELALDRLGVVEDELEYEVVDEARRGLFGIIRGEARIRARVKPISREKPADRRRRRPRERSGRGGRANGAGGERTEAGRSGGRRGNGNGNGEHRDRAPAPKNPRAGAATAGGAAAKEGGAPGGSGGNRRRRRGGRGRSGSGGGSGAARPAPLEEVLPEARDIERAGVEVEVEALPVADQAAHAATFTSELVKAMGYDASVRTTIDGDDLTVHIEGENLGALVGPRGATIQALEEVVRAVVQHHAGGHSAWVHVDVAGYRERRRQALADFARKVADEVKVAGEERVLEPMPAGDRKIVHDAIAEVDGVDTTSEGEEPRRRVVVFPA